MSDAIKFFIRCAWAGTSAFASAGYGSSWAPGTCPATFTTKASLRTAVEAYNANVASAEATHGPISSWGVSAVTDMSQLFKALYQFNADISSWDTSSVTSMKEMFRVRSARALPAITAAGSSMRAACAATAPRASAS